MNIRNNSTAGVGTDANDEGLELRIGSLVLMDVIILFGNSLILASIGVFRTRNLSDMLIGSLALIDFVNACGPVTISVMMYLIHPLGFNVNTHLFWLCQMYVWLSAMLRLQACFIATLMAADRLAAIQTPLRYKTEVTMQRVGMIILMSCAVNFVIATLPVTGVCGIYPYGPICSFDFTSTYAVFIALLGYVQLLFVVICYAGVISGVNKFLSRQRKMKTEQIRATIRTSFRSRTRISSLKPGTDTELHQIANGKVYLTRNSSKSTLISEQSRKSNRQRIQKIKRTDQRGNKYVTAQSPDSYGSTVLTGNQGSTVDSLNRLPKLPSILEVSKGRRSTSLTPLQNIPQLRLSRRSQSLGLNSRTAFSGTTNIVGSGKDTTQQFRRQSLQSRESSFNKNKYNILDKPIKGMKSEEAVRESLQKFKNTSATWKRTRKLALVMGIVVVLFYLSWMPIVVSSNFCYV